MTKQEFTEAWEKWWDHIAEEAGWVHSILVNGEIVLVDLPNKQWVHKSFTAIEYEALNRDDVRQWLYTSSGKFLPKAIALIPMWEG